MGDDKIISFEFDEPHQLCSICHKRFATKICDYVVEYPIFTQFVCHTDRWTAARETHPTTCDKALCDKCARTHGITDFCPYHDKMYQLVKRF